MYHKLQKTLRLVSQLNLCAIDFKKGGRQKAVFNKLASAGARKGLFTPAHQFVRDAIEKNPLVLDTCKDTMVIEMNHEGIELYWNGYGQRVDKQTCLDAELVFRLDEPAKRYFCGLLEGINKPDSGRDVQRENIYTPNQGIVETHPSLNDQGKVSTDNVKNEHSLPETPGQNCERGIHEQYMATDGAAVQKDMVSQTIGQSLAEEAFVQCAQDKVRKLAKDIGFKGEYFSFEREYLSLVKFLQVIACEITFAENMHAPILDSYHRCVYEKKFSSPHDSAKVGSFEADWKDRYHQYRELALKKEGRVDTMQLLAELPYHFLARALNKNKEEATYFMSRQRLCKNLNSTGLQFLKKFIEGLLASTLTVNDLLLKELERKS